MAASSGNKNKVIVTRDDGVRKEYTWNVSRDKNYLYVSSGSRTYRTNIKEGENDDAVAAAAIRLILNNFGG